MSAGRRIGDRPIGDAATPYVIAEIGVNHDGSVDRALELTDAAAAAGADAVKLQLFETDRLMSGAAKLAAYQSAAGETDPIAMLRRLELSIDDMSRVVALAHQRDIHAIVTVFSVELVPVAAQLPWDAYKSASPDIINRPLLEAMAGADRPLIVSTGASTTDEVSNAIEWLRPHGAPCALLQCVSSYPTPPADASIGAMFDLRRLFAGPVGYSDHTAAIDTGQLAVALGADVLEKHLTHDRNARGPDHAASCEPEGLADYVQKARAIRDRAIAAPLLSTLTEIDSEDPRIGGRGKRVLARERDVREVSRQSVVTTRALQAGDVLEPGDLTIKRPGTGIEPGRMAEVIGRPVRRPVGADVPLTSDDLD